jgi:hypothetical protein
VIDPAISIRLSGLRMLLPATGQVTRRDAQTVGRRGRRRTPVIRDKHRVVGIGGRNLVRREIEIPLPRRDRPVMQHPLFSLDLQIVLRVPGSEGTLYDAIFG